MHYQQDMPRCSGMLKGRCPMHLRTEGRGIMSTSMADSPGQADQRGARRWAPHDRVHGVMLAAAHRDVRHLQLRAADRHVHFFSP